MLTYSQRMAALCTTLSVVLAGCEAQKSETPLSPSVAGPIAGVNISPPKLIEPVQGFKIKESAQPIKLIIENAASNGVHSCACSSVSKRGRDSSSVPRRRRC